LPNLSVPTAWPENHVVIKVPSVAPRHQMNIIRNRDIIDAA
jgi:hypothetical protein